jgi:SAM-dependent methyltransferase
MDSKKARSGQLAQVQVEAAHYLQPGYDDRVRFLNYWHQIHYVWSLAPQSVLEIGVGNSFASNYLRQRGINVFTLDIDASLRPDCAGSVLQLPFPDRVFEVVACCEVLEHLPFEYFRLAMSELHRVSSHYGLISVPDRTRAYRFNVQIPLLGEIKKLILMPTLCPRKHVFDGQHHWEINRAGYPLRRMTKIMEDTGFDILESYRMFESPKYHFFVLRKRHLEMETG